MTFAGVLTRRTYLKVTKPWLNWIARRESGFSLFTGRAIWRLHYFSRDTKLHQKYLPFPIKPVVADLDHFMAEEVYNFTSYLTDLIGFQLTSTNLKNKPLPVIMVIPAEKLLTSAYRPHYHYLASLWENFGIPIILHFQTNILEPKAFRLLSEKTCLIQNRSFIPLYSQADAKNFCDVILSNWQTTLPKSTIRAVINLSGRHFLLIKEALRLIVSKQAESALDLMNQMSYLDKVKLIYNSFSPKDKQILKSMVLNLPVQPSQFMYKLGYVATSNSHYTLTIPALHQYIKTNLRQLGLHLNTNQIFYNHLNLSALLTNQEHQCLSYLINHINQIVERDTLAAYLWGDKLEKYSDWAIDKLTQRLRSKLKRYAPDYKLVTKKGRGFMLSRLNVS